MFSFATRGFIAGALLAAGTLSATAAPVTFDFRSGNAVANDGTKTVSGLTVDVDAGPGNLSESSGGLGVTGNGGVQLDDTQALASGDWLLFKFDSNVSLTSFLLNNVSAADGFVFSWGEGALTQSLTVAPLGNVSNPYSYDVAPDALGSWFRIQSLATGSSTSQFLVAAITVDAAPVPQAEAVPEPTSLALVGLALFGAAAARRRRSA